MVLMLLLQQQLTLLLQLVGPTVVCNIHCCRWHLSAVAAAAAW
jgi:hypothetical protein